MNLPIPSISLFLALSALISFLLYYWPAHSPGARAMSILGAIVQGSFIVLWSAYFDPHGTIYQYTENSIWLPALHAQFSLGIDATALLVIALTWFAGIGVHVLLHQEEEAKPLATQLAYTHMLQTCLYGALVSLDLFLFYLFWEAVLVVCVLIWHSQNKQHSAALLYFLGYSLIGSIFLLLGIFLLPMYMHAKNFPPSLYLPELQFFTTGLPYTLETLLLFCCMGIAFAVKTPLFLFHRWQVPTYEKAPIGLLILLSASLVKVGLLGFWRFAVQMFPQVFAIWQPWLMAWSLVGMLYGACLAYRSQNPRKILAYSSMSHANAMFLAIALNNPHSLTAACLLMAAHTLAITLLLLAFNGLKAERSTLSLPSDYKKLATLPFASSIMVAVWLSNMGIPGLGQFPGELLLLFGIRHDVGLNAAQSGLNGFVVFGAVIVGIVLTTVYSLRALHRLLYEPTLATSHDLPASHGTVLLPLLLLLIVLGVYPQSVVRYIFPSIHKQLQPPAFSMSQGHALVGTP
jgi:NADH-quinone oxidoreductase subunit M